MKTLKVKEETIYKMKVLQTNMFIDHKLKLKTYDDVINFLYQYFLEADKKTDDKIIELAKELAKEEVNTND